MPFKRYNPVKKMPLIKAKMPATETSSASRRLIQYSAGIFDRGVGWGDDLPPEQAGQSAFTVVR
jgi:hypothetical protein